MHKSVTVEVFAGGKTAPQECRLVRLVGQAAATRLSSKDSNIEACLDWRGGALGKLTFGKSTVTNLIAL